jgi:hypothetical protein
VEIYCSVHREDAHNERSYDFRPEKASRRAVKEPPDERLVAMRNKLLAINVQSKNTTKSGSNHSKNR